MLPVWQPEMLYRSLLFHRYAPILPTDGARIAASAVTLGFAHIIFLNWIAVVMAAVGGLLLPGTTRGTGRCG
jgi:membrane protease YdiL (CAAX protease family)